MAELHILGNIIGASDFPNSNLTCKWTVNVGDGWKCLEGEEWGQTHVDLPVNPQLTIWSHPIDLHYATTSIKGWPKLIIQVYHQDMFDGYGFSHVPTSPGTHTIEIETWRPTGTLSDQIYSYFLGATPQLKNLDLITNPADRFRLETMTMGKVYIEVSVITRNFLANGIVL